MHFSLSMTIVLYISFFFFLKGGKRRFITDVGSELEIFLVSVPPVAVF